MVEIWAESREECFKVSAATQNCILNIPEVVEVLEHGAMAIQFISLVFVSAPLCGHTNRPS